jgi:uncharacterized cupin superfamily protein
MRRVITGINQQGKSVFTRDDESPHFFQIGNFEMGSLWFDAQASIPNGLGDPAQGKEHTLPQPGQAVVRYVVFPPKAEMEAMMQGADSTETEVGDFQVEAENPAMHTTETIDYGFVLAGSITLELDDGQKKVLNTGDFFLQSGTRHAWGNDTDQRAVIGVVMVGARR